MVNRSMETHDILHIAIMHDGLCVRGGAQHGHRARGGDAGGHRIEHEHRTSNREICLLHLVSPYELLAGLIREGKLSVVAAFFDIESGKVGLLS
jgi:hypothetical protein